jgi:hypothetical protein
MIGKDGVYGAGSALNSKLAMHKVMVSVLRKVKRIIPSNVISGAICIGSIAGFSGYNCNRYGAI